MKQTIRFNTFETNSSSTHNVVIIPDEQWEDWCNGKLFYLQYDWGHYNEKLIKVNNGSRFFTKDFLEKCNIFEDADKMPIKEDFEDEDDYDQALEEWFADMELVNNEHDDEYLECDSNEYTTKSGDKIHIICHYGYDG